MIDVLTPPDVDARFNRDLTTIRERYIVMVPSGTPAVVLWDCHDCGPTHLASATLCSDVPFVTGYHYRDESDLSDCGLDYYHPPRMLWTLDGDECFLVDSCLHVEYIGRAENIDFIK